MPVHDWTRVTAGTFHAFHLTWIAEIQLALNSGILPPDYYAQAEQIAGPLGPDVLTLHTPDAPTNGAAGEPSGGGIAVATARPRARWSASIEMSEYGRRRRTIVIRHSSGDRIVALEHSSGWCSGVAAMSKVVTAFGGREVAEQPADRRP